MYLGIAKGLKRMGGFNIMAGVRITRRNAAWMIWVLMFLGMFWLMWKILVASLWLGYYVYIWPFLKLYAHIKAKKAATQTTSASPRPSNAKYMPSYEKHRQEINAMVKARMAEDDNYVHRTFRVAGVTFKNADGTDRQHLIKMMDLIKGENDISLVPTECEGKPAFEIHANGKQIGNVPADLCDYLYTNHSRIIGFTRCEILGGTVYDTHEDKDGNIDYVETDRELTYGVELTLRLNKE